MLSGLVSVIIPTYNRPNYLPQAVESVLSQTYPSIEIIIIDDGSDEHGARTKEVLKPYLDLSHLTYVYHDNRGVATTVNRGLSLAQGEYIKRLDDDDRLLPTKIARCVEAFQANPNVGLVGTGYYRIDAQGKRMQTVKPRPCPNPVRLLNVMLGYISTQSAIMVRSSVHEKVGTYRNTRWEDCEMWIRIAKEYGIEVIDDPLMEHRFHSGNISFKKTADVERERIGLISEHLQSTPLELLVPNFQSKSHVYALRAMVYLKWSGRYITAIGKARKELEMGFKLSPGDALLSLWTGILAIYGDENPEPLLRNNLLDQACNYIGR